MQIAGAYGAPRPFETRAYLRRRAGENPLVIPSRYTGIILLGQGASYNLRGVFMAKPPRKPTNPPRIRPGQPVPDSGIYRSSKSRTQATMVKHEPAPPTPQKGERWRQIIDTNPD